MPRPLKVFLCHASQDKPEVWKLHRYLKTRGVKPWLDVEDLLPGEDWEVEIPKALFSSDIILVCLSKNSVNKEGYVQKEIVFALDKALEKPEGTIFIVPVKLEDCELPKRLSRYQAVDLFRTDGRKRLLMGLNKRIANLGEDVLPITIEETKQRTPRPIKPKIEKEEKPVEIISVPESDKTSSNEAESSLVVESKKEQAKPFTRILNPATLDPQKKTESKPTRQNYDFRKIGLGGIILIGILSIVFAGNYFLSNLPTSEAPEITPTEEITVTSTFVPTATDTSSLAISTTTRLDIGSTTLGNDGMTLMYVPAGEFTMGSAIGKLEEKPEHQVYLDAFWIDQTEVTNAMYARCVDANVCNPPSDTSSYINSSYFGNSKFEDYPVLYVSWNDAIDYCEYADRRLPSEAEWEKAARGTNGNIYPWGNNNPNDSLLNFDNNLGDTTTVGSYPDGGSIYGVLDMAGNLWEWVNDWYDPNYYSNSPSSNPQGATSGSSKIFRGGSWFDNYFNVRSTARLWAETSFLFNDLGFRCAMDADQ